MENRTTWDLRRVRRFFLVATLAFSSTNLSGATAMATEGLISVKSEYQPKETMERLEAAVSKRGLTIFARVDHAAGAAQVDQPLRPTDLLIFGSPKGGTPLMQAAQTAGIDLPLKALVWQDRDGTTWLSYNDTTWIAGRHQAGPESKAAVSGMSMLLQAIAGEVTTER